MPLNSENSEWRTIGTAELQPGTGYFWDILKSGKGKTARYRAFIDVDGREIEKDIGRGEYPSDMNYREWESETGKRYPAPVCFRLTEMDARDETEQAKNKKEAQCA